MNGREKPPPRPDARSPQACDQPPPPDGGYMQLELRPTVTGPRKRTEDHLEPGTEVRIRGEQGTFIYRYATVSRAGMVSLHLMGAHGFRAVRPEQVVPVRKRRIQG